MIYVTDYFPWQNRSKLQAIISYCCTWLSSTIVKAGVSKLNGRHGDKIHALHAGLRSCSVPHLLEFVMEEIDWVSGRMLLKVEVWTLVNINRKLHWWICYSFTFCLFVAIIFKVHSIQYCGRIHTAVFSQQRSIVLLQCPSAELEGLTRMVYDLEYALAGDSIISSSYVAVHLPGSSL